MDLHYNKTIYLRSRGIANLCTLQKTNLLVIVNRSDGEKNDVLSHCSE